MVCSFKKYFLFKIVLRKEFIKKIKVKTYLTTFLNAYKKESHFIIICFFNSLKSLLTSIYLYLTQISKELQYFLDFSQFNKIRIKLLFLHLFLLFKMKFSLLNLQ